MSVVVELYRRHPMYRMGFTKGLVIGTTVSFVTFAIAIAAGIALGSMHWL